MKKTILSLFLILCMTLVLLPADALANGEAPSGEMEEELLPEETALPAETEETLSAPAAEAVISDEEDENATSGTCGEHLTWKFEGGVLTISGTGAMYDYDNLGSNYPPYYIFHEMITSAVIDPGVTSIGNAAFGYCVALESVVIPSGVTSIGEIAFSDCISLTSITLPDSLKTIGKAAFRSCSSLEDIVLPNGITTLEEGTFITCSSLKSVTLPDTLTTIGYRVFEGCMALESVNFPENLTTIGSYAFSHCGLTSVILPDSVTSIAGCAFIGCAALEEVYILGEVTAIETATFQNCSTLFSILLPVSVASVCDYAFNGCDSLEVVLYTGTEEDSERIEIAETGNDALLDAIWYQFYTESPFTDVVYSESNWYYEPVLWALNMGITTGTSKTTFSPNNYCTRAQAVTFLWRAAGEPEPESSTMPFTDVKSGDYYYDAVLWAVENDITNGMTATTFSPNKRCTRGQIVTFLYRFKTYGMTEVPAINSNTAFTDLEQNAYYYAPVLWAAQEGIAAGITNSTFCPGNYCTRAQIVTFLYRYAMEGLYE